MELLVQLKLQLVIFMSVLSIVVMHIYDFAINKTAKTASWITAYIMFFSSF